MAKRSTIQPLLKLDRIDGATSIRGMVYSALKKAVIELDVYEHDDEVRLDECKLSSAMGVSRTPVREALRALEQEGFVRTVGRRGVFVVRRTKAEIVEMIIAWAALESMAARCAAMRATPEEFAELRAIMDGFRGDQSARSEADYPDVNLAFHEKIVAIGHCDPILSIARNLFLHVQCIRKITIREDGRLARSVTDHMSIIRALESRDPESAGRLVREHALGLAEHVRRHGEFLDAGVEPTSGAGVSADAGTRSQVKLGALVLATGADMA